MINYLSSNPWVVPVTAIVILAVLLLIVAVMLIQKHYSTNSESSKTVDELADEVLAGVWGSGETRKTALTAAGYDYDTVQAAVNAKLKS